MKHYYVVTPEMSEVIPILDYGQGPLEYFCETALVECEDPRDAKSLAIAAGLLPKWLDDSGGSNPFTGLKVEDPLCMHGVCCCDVCNGECGQCMADDEENDKQ